MTSTFIHFIFTGLVIGVGAVAVATGIIVTFGLAWAFLSLGVNLVTILGGG